MVDPKGEIVQSFCRSKAESPKDKLGEIKKQPSERHKVSCLKLNLPSRQNTHKDRGLEGLKQHTCRRRVRGQVIIRFCTTFRSAMRSNKLHLKIRWIRKRNNMKRGGFAYGEENFHLTVKLPGTDLL